MSREQSKIEVLARAFGQGKATAAEVVAAAKARAVGYSPADTYDEMARRVETDESAPATGWDDVTLVYIDDGLTDEQYSELSALYGK
jgi:hypothetical protein